MKKLLAVLAAIGFVAPVAAGVVSCAGHSSEYISGSGIVNGVASKFDDLIFDLNSESGEIVTPTITNIVDFLSKHEDVIGYPVEAYDADATLVKDTIYVSFANNNDEIKDQVSLKLTALNNSQHYIDGELVDVTSGEKDTATARLKLTYKLNSNQIETTKERMKDYFSTEIKGKNQVASFVSNDTALKNFQAYMNDVIMTEGNVISNDTYSKLSELFTISTQTTNQVKINSEDIEGFDQSTGFKLSFFDSIYKGFKEYWMKDWTADYIVNSFSLIFSITSDSEQKITVNVDQSKAPSLNLDYLSDQGVQDLLHTIVYYKNGSINPESDIEYKFDQFINRSATDKWSWDNLSSFSLQNGQSSTNQSGINNWIDLDDPDSTVDLVSSEGIAITNWHKVIREAVGSSNTVLFKYDLDITNKDGETISLDGVNLFEISSRF